MTTLQQEFEEWLKNYDKDFSLDEALDDALNKIDELKKKYKV